MGLGTNRDYKTRDRIARNGLARHYARMQELIASGMDRESASQQAYREMTSKQSATMKRTRIERMNRFGRTWKIWLECGHTFECSLGYANDHQFYIGKPISCDTCDQERKTQEGKSIDV